MNKKIILITSLAIFLVVAIVGITLMYNNTGNEKISYNMNPDNSKKIIGSAEVRKKMSLLPITSIDDLVGYADLIVTGEVISEGVTGKAGWPKVEGDTQGKTDLSNLPPVDVTYTKIKINKTLYGKADSDIITLLQLGKAGDDKGETKVKNKKKMLFVLRKANEGEDIYSSVCYEDGLFEISDDDKVLSLSNEITESKYDGTHIDLLIKDVIKGLKNKKR